MSDIAERLRAACGYENVTDNVRRYNSGASNGLVIDAAAEIERLRAENAELLAALKPFADDAAFIIAEEEDWPGDMPLLSGGKICTDDYRRAVRAVGQSAQQEDGK